MACVAESAGALLGGRTLDQYIRIEIKNEIRAKLGDAGMTAVLDQLNAGAVTRISERDFLQSFDVEEARKGFGNDKPEYSVSYGGSHRLPRQLHNIIKPKAIVLPRYVPIPKRPVH